MSRKVDILTRLSNLCDESEYDFRLHATLCDAYSEIVKLRDWIREEGKRTNICTKYILGEKCEYCECKLNN